MSVIVVPKIIRDKFGEECTDAFTGLIKEIDLDARKDAIAIAAERFENRLTEEIGKVDQRITEESGKLRLEMEKLRTEIEKNKVDIIKWMFIFWVGQIGVLSAIIIAMMRLFK